MFKISIGKDIHFVYLKQEADMTVSGMNINYARWSACDMLQVRETNFKNQLLKEPTFSGAMLDGWEWSKFCDFSSW